jgi:hypothetical protein
MEPNPIKPDRQLTTTKSRKPMRKSAPRRPRKPAAKKKKNEEAEALITLPLSLFV